MTRSGPSSTLIGTPVDSTGSPVMFGVLTTENIEQAIERAGTKAGNKGYDCAAGAIEMVNLIHELRQRTADDSLSAMPPVQDEP